MNFLQFQLNSGFCLENIQRAERVAGRPERRMVPQKCFFCTKTNPRGGDKRVEEGSVGGARADLRLFGAERSPAGSGCDPAARSRSYQSLSATWRTRPQTSDRLGSIRGPPPAAWRPVSAQIISSPTGQKLSVPARVDFRVEA